MRSPSREDRKSTSKLRKSFETLACARSSPMRRIKFLTLMPRRREAPSRSIWRQQHLFFSSTNACESFNRNWYETEHQQAAEILRDARLRSLLSDEENQILNPHAEEARSAVSKHLAPTILRDARLRSLLRMRRMKYLTLMLRRREAPSRSIGSPLARISQTHLGGVSSGADEPGCGSICVALRQSGPGLNV